MSNSIQPQAPSKIFSLDVVTAFLIHEADLLDNREFESWRDLFLDDGYYWVPSDSEQSSPHNTASLFFDDKSTMATRFERLRHPQIHSQLPPTRTCRIVGNVRLLRTDDQQQLCQVVSKLIMADSRGPIQRTFAARVEHQLRYHCGDLRIAWKRVDLINCDQAHEAISIPF